MNDKYQRVLFLELLVNSSGSRQQIQYAALFRLCVPVGVRPRSLGEPVDPGVVALRTVGRIKHSSRNRYNRFEPQAGWGGTTIRILTQGTFDSTWQLK